MANVARPGLDPSVLVAPDYQVQMQQAERQRALAQVLRQQALQDTEGNGGRVSWTQGLARVLNAVAANKLNKRADETQMGANRAYAAGMQRMFGGGASSDAGSPEQPVPANRQGPISAPQASPTPSGPVDPLAPLPDAPPQAAQQPPSSSPSPAQTGGAFNLTGNPNRDMAMYVMNPDKYSEAIIANAGKGAAPTDTEVVLAHAQEAMARGDTATATALLEKLRKDNYIAPVNARPGGWTEYADGRRVFNPAAPVNGAVPVQNPDGSMSWKLADGAQSTAAAMAGATAGAKASAEAPFQVEQAFDPKTQQPILIPRSNVTGGTLGGYYQKGQAGGVAAGPTLGQTSAANTAGTNSANQFNDAVSAGSTAKNANFQLDRLMVAAKGLSTGPGSEGMSHLKSGINAISGAIGTGPVFDRERIAKFDEVKKNAAALGLSLSQAAGQQTTDARLRTALDALPNAQYSPAAIQEVGLNLKGLQAAALARGNAAAAWQQQHGPGDFPAFSKAWNDAYNPEIFYNIQKGFPAFQKWAQGLPPSQRAHVLQQYRQMKSLGAY